MWCFWYLWGNKQFFSFQGYKIYDYENKKLKIISGIVRVSGIGAQWHLQVSVWTKKMLSSLYSVLYSCTLFEMNLPTSLTIFSVLFSKFHNWYQSAQSPGNANENNRGTTDFPPTQLWGIGFFPGKEIHFQFVIWVLFRGLAGRLDATAYGCTTVLAECDVEGLDYQHLMKEGKKCLQNMDKYLF